MSNKSQENLSNEFDNNEGIYKQKMNCKDGFCYLPNASDKIEPDVEKINIFDPV